MGVAKDAVRTFMSNLSSMSVTTRLGALKTFLAENMPVLNLTRVKELTNKFYEKAGGHGKRLVSNAWEAATQLGLRPWIESREAHDQDKISSIQTVVNRLRGSK